MNTPWGKSDHSEELGDGIVFYYTPSHGGIHVNEKYRHLLPAAAFSECSEFPWYEEDCDAPIVLHYLWDYLHQSVRNRLHNIRPIGGDL